MQGGFSSVVVEGVVGLVGLVDVEGVVEGVVEAVDDDRRERP